MAEAPSSPANPDLDMPAPVANRAEVASRFRTPEERARRERIARALRKKRRSARDWQQRAILAEADLDAARADSERTRDRLLRLGADYDKVRAALAEARVKADEFASEREELARSRDEAKSRTDEVHDRSLTLDRALSEARREASAFEMDRVRWDAERQRLLAEIEAGLDASLQEAEGWRVGSERARAALKADLESVNGEVASLRTDLDDTRRRLAEALVGRDQALADGKSAETMLSSLRAEVAMLRAEPMPAPQGVAEESEPGEATRPGSVEEVSILQARLEQAEREADDAKRTSSDASKRVEVLKAEWQGLNEWLKAVEQGKLWAERQAADLAEKVRALELLRASDRAEREQERQSTRQRFDALVQELEAARRRLASEPSLEPDPGQPDPERSRPLPPPRRPAGLFPNAKTGLAASVAPPSQDVFDAALDHLSVSYGKDQK